MKKVIYIVLCLILATTITACTKAPEEEMKSANYKIVNSTGNKVEELFLYEAGSNDKGKNYASNGLENDDSLTLKPEAPISKIDSIVYVLEFKTVGGETQKFETLHFEEATIELLSIDEAAGATQIRFGY